jgi:hypothetical protein
MGCHDAGEGQRAQLPVLSEALRPRAPSACPKVAIYSPADKLQPHRYNADESYCERRAGGGRGQRAGGGAGGRGEAVCDGGCCRRSTGGRPPRHPHAAPPPPAGTNLDLARPRPRRRGVAGHAAGELLPRHRVDHQDRQAGGGGGEWRVGLGWLGLGVGWGGRKARGGHRPARRAAGLGARGCHQARPGSPPPPPNPPTPPHRPRSTPSTRATASSQRTPPLRGAARRRALRSSGRALRRSRWGG